MVRAYSSVVEHYVDIVGVASSILATPTIHQEPAGNGGFFAFRRSDSPQQQGKQGQNDQRRNRNSGKDADAAREGWKRFRGSGHEVSYWQQDEQGRWQNRAAAK